MDPEPKHSIIGGVIAAFLKGNLAILLIVIALAAGAAALFLTPREEEPQIVVPLADIMVMYPGGTAQEVERLVSARLERLLYVIEAQRERAARQEAPQRDARIQARRWARPSRTTCTSSIWPTV